MLRARTLLSRSPRDLLSRIQNLPSSFYIGPSIFALSANAGQSCLPDLVQALTADRSHPCVGCLSAPIQDDFYSCSILSVDSKYGSVFRSTLEEQALTQVGRWHAYRDSQAKLQEEEGGYKREGLSQSNATSVLYMSDVSSKRITAHLRDLHPSASKVGLLASPTPFVTGRPITLFHGDRVHSDGAVGLELSLPTSISTAYPETLIPITGPVTVTGSEGNLVHELDGSNPSKMLLEAIRRMPTQPHKDDFYFLGIIRDGKLDAMHTIVSGDPSRGTMALETQEAPRKGETIQIFYQPQNVQASRYVVPATAESQHVKVAVSVAPTRDALDDVEAVSTKDSDGMVMDDHFVAASESGWVLDRGNADENGTSGSWRCTALGAHAELTLDKTPSA